MTLIQAEALDLEKSVLDTVAEVAEDWRIDDIKGLLGRCNFKADMLDRKVSLLSGGEKVNLYNFCNLYSKLPTLCYQKGNIVWSFLLDAMHC